MNETAKLIGNVSRKLQTLDWEAEGIARQIFESHRTNVLSVYLKIIRLWREAELYHYLFQKTFNWDLPTFEFCNAAGMILTYGDVDAQKLFLAAANEGRSRMAQAVIDDGGIYDENQHWMDLWQ